MSKSTEKAILEHIRSNNGFLDSVDITRHFKLRVDLVMNYLLELKNKNLIKQQYVSGGRYKYFCTE